MATTASFVQPARKKGLRAARNTAGNSKNPNKEKSRITAAPAAPKGQAGVEHGKCGTEESLCLGLMDKNCTEWL